MPQKIKVGEVETKKNKNLGVDLLIGEIPQLIRPTSSKKEKIIGINQYKDEKGNVLYEVVKQREGEPYLCRQPIGNGEYEYSIKNVRRVIYNLPAVLEAIEKGEVIFITEGESKVDTLSELKITATTVFSKYTNKWKEYYNQFLDGARGVIILQDDDQNGIEYANNTYTTLKEMFSEDKIGIMPITSICPEINKQGADITDVREFMKDDERLTLILKTIASQI